MNLLLMQNGVKVADFGLAKVLEGTAASHTGAQTAAYAAPEMIQGTVSHQSDQYSLAVTYYHLRLGRLPFTGNPHQVMFAHLQQTPDLSALPKAEAVVLGRALAKTAADRWPSCGAFAAALVHAVIPPPAERRAAASLPGNTRTERPPAKTRTASPRRDSRTPPIRSQPVRKIRWPWLMTAGMLLLLPLILVGVFSHKAIIDLVARNEQRQPGPDPVPPQPEAITRGQVKQAEKPPETLARRLEGDNPAQLKLEKPVTSLPPMLTVELGDGVTMEFVLIDPKSKPDRGKFRMGSPKSERDDVIKKYDLKPDTLDDEVDHDVELTRPFYLAMYPVTQEQYKKLIGTNPSWFQKGGRGADQLKDVKDQDTSRFPVEKVSWEDANDYCLELMKKHGAQMPAALREQRYRFALPTEAQWEYACRAGTTTPYHFGKALNGKQANCDGNYPYGTDEKGPCLERTCKVGGDDSQYPANAWGLHDMHGNVWQWCEDYYGPYNEDLKKPDPVRKIKYSEDRRVLRGGSWGSYPRRCRAVSRDDDAPDVRTNDVGFRVAVRLD
jgi:formylglycine-generating enzyme required for sulfatase activity